ncbi:MAG: pseudouridine synthase [Pseudochelatococcus sp.]|jgi:23S rRNA pseudouridine2605 synthase|uniref:pseudouridine synthase n=1 Tax=Pseudochelatococcus sp. TaxID=2020869 RepID=UPI003D8E55B9
MTDRSKDERRPARRPGDDAARPSKGVRKFGGPRPFAGAKDAGDRTRGEPARHDKPSRHGEERPRAGQAKPRFDKPRFDKNPRADKPRFGGEGRSGENRGGDRREGAGRPDRPARRFDGAEGARPEGRRFDRPPRHDKPGFDKPRFGKRPSDARRLDGAGGDAGRFRKPQTDERPEAPAAGPERIAKVMARAGVASRRDAEVMIAEGRVAVNGKVIDTPATLVTAGDRVLIDGAPMPQKERTRLWLFHKPRGLVTTARDPEGRPTVFDDLPADLPRVVTVGRLDINTEGLLLLTNDGGLARVLALPDTGWLRRYRVRAYGAVDQAQLDALRDGITIDDMHYGPVEAQIQRTQGDNVWLTLGLREGKNREVKRILEHLGLRVNRLIRVSFGPFQLGDLGEGALEEVRTRILKDQLGEALAREAGVDFDAGIAEPDPVRAAPAPRNPLREGRYRSKEDFQARAPRQSAEAAPARTREAYEQRSQERAVWRDEETEAKRPRGKRVPRRGADAREARAQSGARDHMRAASVTDPGGRTVKVERLVSAPALAERPVRTPRRPAPEEARGDRPAGGRSFEKRGADGFAGERPSRPFRRDDGGERRGFSDRKERGGEGFRRDDRPRGARPDFKARGDRPAGGRSFEKRGADGFAGERPSRPFRRDDGGERRGLSDRKDRGGEGFRRDDRPRGDRPDFKARGDRPAGERAFGEKRPDDRREGRSFAGKSHDGRPFDKKPFRERPADGRTGGDKQFRGDKRPDDRKAGGRFAGKSSSHQSFAGKRPDSRPSGSRPGGSRPGGPRPPRRP